MPLLPQDASPEDAWSGEDADDDEEYLYDETTAGAAHGGKRKRADMYSDDQNVYHFGDYRYTRGEVRANSL